MDFSTASWFALVIDEDDDWLRKSLSIYTQPPFRPALPLLAELFVLHDRGDSGTWAIKRRLDGTQTDR
ncbi:hypothetical protein QHL1GM_03465 [Halomonas sp. QHL1]|nr:hypothetical protein QHL1GM_03465 [Halomonas sp. QHL1]